jgi:ubiquinone/menaquinone biosynthesis C-methylase UbiE
MTSMIKGRTDLQRAYRDTDVAREYIARRFETPIGALLHERQVSTVRELIERQGLRTALEVAPGPARVTTAVAPRLESVTLVDASLEMLREAHGRLLAERGSVKIHLMQADAFRLPLKNSFDLVFSFRLVRHFERGDRVALYRQFASVLQPGSWLVFDAINERVATPLRARDTGGELKHFDALLSPEQIRDELGEAGFVVDRLVGVQHRMPMLQWTQVYVAPRADSLARTMMAAIDRSGGEPLEWVVVCRRV